MLQSCAAASSSVNESVNRIVSRYRVVGGDGIRWECAEKRVELNQRWWPGGVLDSPLALALADSADGSVSLMSCEAALDSSR